MATPLKTNVVSIVPSKDLCVSCSVSSNQRYYIVKKSGEKGPSYALASEIYSTSFYCCENYGTYVCKTCYRLLERIIETKKTQDRLSVRIYQNSQSLQIRKSEKRVIDRTPNSKQKISFIPRVPCLRLNQFPPNVRQEFRVSLILSFERYRYLIFLLLFNII